MQIKDPPDSPNPFQTIPCLHTRLARTRPQLAFSAKSSAAWKRWRSTLRAKVRELTGYDRLRPAPLKPCITETVDCGTYVRQRVEIQTEPGLTMPLFVLAPKGKGPFPPVIAAHGHGSCGKMAVADVPINADLANSIKNHRYAYGVEFAKRGCIVFCPDARGFGERREKGGVPLMGSSCGLINSVAYPLGLSLAGMWAWELHRVIDYIQSRRDCARGPLACVGLSGGGLQTLYATALDDRITAAVISGYFYGVQESLLDMANCSCNYVPQLWDYADMGDLGALIAPRPLCIETGNRDPLNGASGLKNVKPQVATVRRAYKLLNASSELVHDIFDGEHRWNGTVAVPFIMKHLNAYFSKYSM